MRSIYRMDLEKTMVKEIIFPLINANEPEAMIVDIVVQEGQRIQVGDAMFVLETTKSTMEVAAEEPGYVIGIRNRAGDIIRAGDVFGFIAETEDWQPEESLQRSTVEVNDPMYPPGLRISLPALALAKSENLDLTKFPRGVFITREMVQEKLDSTWNREEKVGEHRFDPTEIVIYGAGGHGKSVLELIMLLGTYDVLGFIDDGIPKGESVLGIPVLGDHRELPKLYKQGVRLAINAVGGIGNILIREKVFHQLYSEGFGCPAIVHPKAFIEASAEMAAGTQVFPFAYVGSDVRVGFGSIINTAAIVSHECKLGERVNISPKAVLAGGVNVGDKVLIGMGVTINLGVKIGEGTRIGNGATVKEDVPARHVLPAGSIFPP